MALSYRSEAPADAATQLSELHGPKLLSFYRALPWSSFLDKHLDSVPVPSRKVLLKDILSAVDDELVGEIFAPAEDDTGEETVSQLRLVYLIRTVSHGTTQEVIDDIKRAWDARASDVEGRTAAGSAIDIIHVVEKGHGAARAIGETLQAVGLRCNEVLTRSKDPQPSSFYSSSMKAGTCFKRIMAFWRACVCETTVEGFFGRYSGESVKTRRKMLRDRWTADKVSDLNPSELKRMAQFISKGPVSPTAAGCSKVLLAALASDLTESSTSQSSSSTEDEDDGAFVASGPKKTVPRKKKGKGQVSPPRSNGAAGRSKPKALSLDEFDSSDESNGEGDECDSEGSTSIESALGFSRSEVGKLPKLGFHGLSKRMQQTLVAGGPDLQQAYLTFSRDINTMKQLNQLVEFFQAGESLTEWMCRGTGLEEDPEDCAEGKLKEKAVRLRSRQARLLPQLGFPLAERRAPFEIMRMMSEGSIVLWTKQLVLQAGPVNRENADGHLAREIMSMGLILAALLDEFHPSQVVFTDAVERIVRRLLVLEEAVDMDRKERGANYESRLAFMGLGGKTLRGTKSLM